MTNIRTRDDSIVAAHKAMAEAIKTAWMRDERATADHMRRAKEHLKTAGFLFGEQA